MGGWAPLTFAFRSQLAPLLQTAAFPSTRIHTSWWPHSTIPPICGPQRSLFVWECTTTGLASRRPGHVVELLANRHVPHAEQQLDRRVSFRQGQFALQIDLPALQPRDLVDLDQGCCIDAGVRGTAEIRERREQVARRVDRLGRRVPGFIQK